MTEARPLGPDDFAALMARLGPFEPRPRIAVAVSGGADSLALALLAAEWAVARGGEAAALTVDHQLRPTSAAEAAQVAEWLGRHGIPHHILEWQGSKPASDLQAAARQARHGLLGRFCADAGILHLLLGHHREDQAETLLLRLGRGSGVDGLSAMAAVQPTPWGQLLRPLLDVSRDRLAATLKARGQDWVEDPSNRNPAFARVRLRALAPLLAAEGLSPARLGATAGRMGRARSALEQAVAAAAVAGTFFHPAGFARLDLAHFRTLPEEVALRLLSRLLLSIGGGAYSPRLERLERLFQELCNGPVVARTLAGCRLAPEGGELLVCREPSRMQGRVALVPGAVVTWDGRFRVEVRADAAAGLWLGPLGVQGWRRVAALMKPARPLALPALVRPSLPTLYSEDGPTLYGEDGISAVPHLGYNHDFMHSTLRSMVPFPMVPVTAAVRCLV
jgi:tRNA(Ile)-lysidine synthase